MSEFKIGEALTLVRAAGFEVMMLSTYHARITNPKVGQYIDFWPTKGTWIAQPAGTRGIGTESVIRYARGEGTINGRNRMLIEEGDLDPDPEPPDFSHLGCPWD